MEREQTPRGKKGALYRAGWAGPAGVRGSGGKREIARQQGRGREGREPGCKIWGGRDGQTAQKAGEGGRLGVLGARGGVPGGQELGNLPADVQEGSAWRSSSGLGAVDQKRPRWGGVTRDM